MQSMNWSDLIEKSKNAGGGDPVPANSYLVTVASCEAKKTKDGLKDMLKIKAKIVGGPYDGKTVWNNMTLTTDNDNAVAIFLRHLAAFGLGDEYLIQQPTFEQIAAALLNRQAIFKVSVGAYGGKPKNDVDDVLPASAVPSVQAPQAQPAPVPASAPVPVPPTAPVAPAPAPVPQSGPPVPVAPIPAPGPAPVPVTTSAPVPQEPPF